jgi:hypothetical protein
MQKIMAKRLIRKFRDNSFQIVEEIFIQVGRIVPRSIIKSDKRIVLASREARGSKVALEDDLFFRELKKNSHLKYEIKRYNRIIWIFDSFYLIWISKLYKRTTIVLIQYVPEFHRFPSMKLLNHLQLHGAEIVKIWFDSSSEILWRNRILRISHLGTRNYLVDTNFFISKYGCSNNSYMYIPPPIEIFNFIPIMNRKFFIYYSGGISKSGSYGKRDQILQYLSASGLSITGSTYNRDSPTNLPSYDQYRKDLASSLCALNFTWKDQADILPARTWEILSSGVLLIQNKSSAFNGDFVPGKHYLEFTTKEELFELIMSLSKKLDTIERISLEGKKRYDELYTNKRFWPLIFNQTHL